MKIVIPGGSGQVGRVLARGLTAAGHEVVVLSRGTGGGGGVRVVGWDGKTLGAWAGELEGADVVINLAGRSVNCRYGAENRRRIMDSRVASTRVLGLAIGRAKRPPRVWLQASTATIYAHRFDAANDEATGIIGGTEADAPAGWRFSIDVAKAWEQVAEEAPTPHTRKVLLRTAIVMSPDSGGAFAALLGLVRWGLGGRQGDGRQYVSWIHDQDFVQAVQWLIARDDLQGPVILASPQPVLNAQFMHDLRAAWGIRLGLPATRWMLEVGAFLLRTETELLFKSRRVAPTCLLESGFTFEFPHWPAAAADLCARWRAANGRRAGQSVAHDTPHKTANRCEKGAV